jgi:hypothetical protein
MSIEIRQYEVPIFKTLGDGWRQLKDGNWKPLLGASLLIFLLQTLLIDVPTYFIDENNLVSFTLFLAYSFLIYIFITFPLRAGFMMLGVHLVVGQHIKTRQIFNYLKLQIIGQLFLLTLCFLVRIGIPLLIIWAPIYLMSFFPMIAFLVVTLPRVIFFAYMAIASLITVYIFIRYIMAIPLMLDKKISAWKAMTFAARAFNQHWFKLYLLVLMQFVLGILPGTLLGLAIFTVGYLVSSLILITLAMPVFAIGIVFMMPWWMTVYGVLYQKMFGSEKGVAHAGS